MIAPQKTLLCLALACTAAALALPAAAADWTGVWETNWGRMLIWQDGNLVRGTYDWEDGRLTGHVEGSRLYFIWREEPTYSGDIDAGPGYFDLSSDDLSFSGAWGYGETVGWQAMITAGGWDGTRVVSAGVATIIDGPTVAVEPAGRVTLTWTTDVPSSTYCQWGTTPAYELGQTESPVLGTYHQVLIEDLTPAQPYHVRVGSFAENESYGQTTWSSDLVVDLAAPTAVAPLPWGRVKSAATGR